jgi:hypothetical protein
MSFRVARLACLAGTLLLNTACYMYAPSSTAPAAGSEVAVVLTDKGRIALNDRVGPEMDELRGRLMSSSDTNVVISITESVTLRGVSAKWTDEVLPLSREYFGSLRVKEFSKGRSTVTAGAATAAAVFLILNRGIVTGSDGTIGEPSTPPTGTGPSTRVGTLSIPFRSDF